MTEDMSKMSPDELTAYLGAVDWWRRYSVGRAIQVGARGGAIACPDTTRELAWAISWIAIPKQHVKGLPWAVPIGGVW